MNIPNKIQYRLIGILLILLLLTTLTALNLTQPTTPTHSNEPNHLIITTNYGNTHIQTNTTPYQPHTTALNHLKKFTSTTTSYGGAFIQTINNIPTRPITNTDWFYYINGYLSTVGAGSYTLYPGDTQHWDYHPWENANTYTAIIGHYPEPFHHGYAGKTAPTIIHTNTTYFPLAQQLQHHLTTYHINTTISTTTLTTHQKQTHNIILLNHITNPTITTFLNTIPQTHLPITITNHTAHIIINATPHTFTDYALITATQNPWNPNGTWHCETVVWLITATTDQHLTTITTLLTQQPATITNTWAILLSNNTLYKVPS